MKKRRGKGRSKGGINRKKGGATKKQGQPKKNSKNRRNHHSGNNRTVLLEGLPGTRERFGRKFVDYFEKDYGERLVGLLEAFTKPVHHVAVMNTLLERRGRSEEAGESCGENVVDQKLHDNRFPPTTATTTEKMISGYSLNKDISIYPSLEVHTLSSPTTRGKVPVKNCQSQVNQEIEDTGNRVLGEEKDDGLVSSAAVEKKTMLQRGGGGGAKGGITSSTGNTTLLDQRQQEQQHQQQQLQAHNDDKNNNNKTNSNNSKDSKIYHPPPKLNDQGLLMWYWLDKASLMPPISLLSPPPPRSIMQSKDDLTMKGEKAQTSATGLSILDMCAAPGGKSMILSMLAFHETTRKATRTTNVNNHLTCNEKSVSRIRNLKHVIKSYIPDQLRSNNIRIVNHDATRWVGAMFDRVLADVPCSSERHVVMEAHKRRMRVDPAQWSPARCKRYASTQFQILLSAVRTTNKGALIVYSTCSIASAENEKVVRKVLKKTSHVVEVVERCGPFSSEDLVSMGAEHRDPGWILLPDRSGGCGPIYWVVVVV